MDLPSPSRPPDRTRNAPGTTLTVSLLGALLFLGGGASADPVRVRTEVLLEILEVPVYSAPATVVARNAPQLAAEIDARVVALLVDVGDRVTVGAELAELDCQRLDAIHAAADADLARVRARRHFARQQLLRARNLEKNKSISEELLDQRQTDLAVADADLTAAAQAERQATIDRDHCRIRAPFDAVVTARLLSVGDYATRGTPVIGLIETAGQEVSVALRHDQLDGLRAATDPVFDSNGDRHPLRLRTLLPVQDTLARTREARLTFTDRPALPGTAGRVVWQGPRSQLPAGYLVRRDGELGVFLLRSGKAHFVAIPGAQDGRPATVDLPPETLLITEGRQRLVDAAEVLVDPTGDPSE